VRIYCSTRVVLISDWRKNRELDHLREELAAAGVECSLLVDARSVVVVDDGYDMGPLEGRFVRTSPLNGLDQDAASHVLRLFALTD
jgi:hypothetical protein